MGIIRKFLGPKSKYDESLPYTYLAKVKILEDNDELYSHYFADTICSLVEYLYERKILPNEVELYGVYRSDEIQLNKNICMNTNGGWLLKPEICNALQDHFNETNDELYKGHTGEGSCCFDDREKECDGP